MEISTFKDFLADDIDNVFLNESEFGENVMINDKPMVVVMDEEALKKQNMKNAEKLAQGELLFYVKRSYFNHIPQADKLMKFNDKKYRILSVIEQLGVLSITLARYQG